MLEEVTRVKNLEQRESVEIQKVGEKFWSRECREGNLEKISIVVGLWRKRWTEEQKKSIKILVAWRKKNYKI